jgi:putative ABC transport system substrate-binding protein
MRRSRSRCGRRRFLQAGLAIGGLALLAGCGTPLPVARPSRVRRIGYLTAGSTPPGPEPLSDAFRQGLRELGWVEGQNVAVEFWPADGKLERLPEVAADLVRSGVDLIHAATTPVALAAMQATATIPIVFAAPADPVLQGLVGSLARPGRNATGLSSINVELTAKRVQLLKEAVPSASRLVVITNPELAGNATYRAFGQAFDTGARASGLQLRHVSLRGAGDLGSAAAAIADERPDVLAVQPDPVLYGLRGPIADIALRLRLPAIADTRENAQAGLLLAYGAQFPDLYRRSATYADQILRGAKPGELPVERPTLFDFIVNVKTAKALGLAISDSVLQQATDAIQ